MTEAEYIGVYSYKRKYYKLSNLQKALIIEDYLADRSGGLEKLAIKYSSNIKTVSSLITDVLFNNPINPIIITLKSAV